MKLIEALIRATLLCMIFLLIITTPDGARAADDITQLRQQLKEQRELIQQQMQMLKAQQQQIEKQEAELDRLSKKMEEIDPGSPTTTVISEPGLPDAPQDVSKKTKIITRDPIGDLNREGILAGDFPGSLKIPGPNNVSLRIAGFIKTVAIADSDAEGFGSNFLPALLGAQRSDDDGSFSFDATLSRVSIDGRAPLKTGDLRGYAEWDFNDGNDGDLDVKMRHAYGTWDNQYGTLLAGHTWSTMMDLKILPEGLTEPTVSGAIFRRHAMVRWSQPLNSAFTLHAALEDPSSSDIYDESNYPELGNTDIPDGVLAIEYNHSQLGHLRLNSILRNLKVTFPDGRDDNKIAWGVSLSGHLKLLERDRWMFSSVYGEGLGRYLLGIVPNSGSAVVPGGNTLSLKDNWGLMTAYEHHWSENLRSSAMIGYAKSDPLDWQSAGTFESSAYGAANLMWEIQPQLTIGIEYAYGQRENKDGSDLDNHRIALGIQIF